MEGGHLYSPGEVLIGHSPNTGKSVGEVVVMRHLKIGLARRVVAILKIRMGRGGEAKPTLVPHLQSPTPLYRVKRGEEVLIAAEKYLKPRPDGPADVSFKKIMKDLKKGVPA